MNKCYVLIVEDEKNIRGLMQTILTSNGYGVLTAKTGEEAMMLLTSRPYSTTYIANVLQDLPGIHGIALR